MKTNAASHANSSTLISIPRKAAALLAGVAIAGSLASCGSEDSAASSDSTVQTAATQTSARTSASSTSATSSSPVAENNADFLDDFEEVDSTPFTGNGSGDLAGTRFTTPDESVHCHIISESAVCAVPGEHSEWPDADRGNDGVRDMPNAPAPTIIGWMESVGAPLGSKPKNWIQQGTFPSVNTGVPLEDGKKLDVLVSFESDERVTCGSKDNNITCVNGDHGFTVGTDTYATW